MIDMGRGTSSKRRQAMMGQRQFQSKLYYQLSLERLVPRDHLLRRIAEGVDFSFVRPLCRPYYSHTGQPSVDPVVIFKMLLIGYLYGVTSERRLAEDVSLHLAYRWFLGYDFDVATPDHSVLSKARARLSSGVFEEFFRQSIELCRQAGLLDEGPVYVDSTLIRAGASVDSLKRRDDLIQPPMSVTEYLQRLEEENSLETETSEATPGSSRSLPPNQQFVSRTDPEATLVNRPDFGRHLAYKAHLAVAGKRGQVITAAVATTGIAADERLLPEVLWQHRRLSSLGVPAVVADAKTGRPPTTSTSAGSTSRHSFPPPASAICARTSGVASTLPGCQRRTLTSVLPARSYGALPTLRAVAGSNTGQRRTVAGPARMRRNARRRAEKEPSTAPGRRSLSRLRRSGWPALWASGGWWRGRSTRRVRSGWPRRCTAYGRHDSEADTESKSSFG
jgi:transposase